MLSLAARTRRRDGLPASDRGGRPWMRRLDAAGRILADVDARCPATADISGHPDLAVLGGLDGALAYLHETWVTAFGVAVDEELERGAALAEAARRARSRVAATRPALAAVLRHHAGHPAVRRAADAHHQLLAGAGPVPPDVFAFT